MKKFNKITTIRELLVELKKLRYGENIGEALEKIIPETDLNIQVKVEHVTGLRGRGANCKYFHFYEVKGYSLPDEKITLLSNCWITRENDGFSLGWRY